MSTDTKLLAAQARIKVLRAWIIDSGMVAESDPINYDLAPHDDTTELDALIADAARLDALEFHLFQHQWNGVVWSASKTHWRLAGNYRHTMQHMVGETFREAIDAMKEATP